MGPATLDGARSGRSQWGVDKSALTDTLAYILHESYDGAVLSAGPRFGWGWSAIGPDGPINPPFAHSVFELYASSDEGQAGDQQAERGLLTIGVYRSLAQPWAATNRG